MTKKCTFCGISQDTAYKLISGPNVFICDECVDTAYNLIHKGTDKKSELVDILGEEIPKPKEIYNHLSKYVVGQEHAKKVVSVAVYNHYDRIKQNRNSKKEKKNILFIGPTGTGKTYLIKILADFLKVPFFIADATSLTEAGYVGEDVENILLGLFRAAQDNIEKTEIGIIYIDEIDKIARATGTNRSITRDVSGEGVQQTLLKILEGKICNVPSEGGRKKPNDNFLKINTQNILFICGGAFHGIEDIKIGNKTLKEVFSWSELDLNNKKLLYQNNLFDYLSPDFLKHYGFLPEFCGRFSSIAFFHELSKRDLIKILNVVENSYISQYEEDFNRMGVELIFTDEAIQLISERTIKLGIGARGLLTVLQSILLDVMFEAPGNDKIHKCIVGNESVTKKVPPIILDKDGNSVVLQRNKVFICYSRKDEMWLNAIKTMLSPVLRKGIIDIWYDKKIKPSKKWRNEIKNAFSETKIAVLLVSPNFLESKFIMEEELPYFLKLADKSEISLLWILISNCLYDQTKIVEYQAAYDISKPLDNFSDSEKNKALVEICQVIIERTTN